MIEKDRKILTLAAWDEARWMLENAGRVAEEWGVTGLHVTLVRSGDPRLGGWVESDMALATHVLVEPIRAEATS